MSKCDLAVQLAKENRVYAPGESVRGQVLVSVTEAIQCRGLTASLRWRTHGRGNRREGPATVVKLFEGEWKAGEQRVYSFELPMPAGPATYHGTVLNVDYYVTAQADMPWALDPKAEAEVLLPPADSPDYSFGSKYVPPEAEVKAMGSIMNVGSVLVLGCFGGPGVLLLLSGIAAIASVVVSRNLGALMTGVFLTFFGGAFTLVGVGLTYKLQKKRLAQRRLGDPAVTLEPNPARAGERVSVRFMVQPRAALTLGESKLRLRCRETVVSGSGTNRTTHTHEVHTSEQSLGLAGRPVQPGEIVSFQETVVVPDEAAPTFVADDNELKWTLAVSIGIPGWPDWEAEYPLTVRPG
jgi:hypothetical protein